MEVADKMMRLFLGSSGKLGFLLHLYETYVPERASVMLVLYQALGVHSRFCAAFSVRKMIDAVSRPTARMVGIFVMRLQIADMLRRTVGTSSSYFGALVGSIITKIKNPFFFLPPRTAA